MENNWDLQAVVRSCGKSSLNPIKDPIFCSSSSILLQEDDIELLQREEVCESPSFQHLSSTRSLVDELEDLCKPFFHARRPPPPTTTTTQPRVSSHEGRSSFWSRESHERLFHTRKKNQQKKVVCQVPADGLPTDMWAWRKYGQKPIKGSSNPRGYYRCSSSKGCPARKQVERSPSTPHMLLIRYSGEHNHTIPTHRSSLSGTTRNKISSLEETNTNTSTGKGFIPSLILEEGQEEQDKQGNHTPRFENVFLDGLIDEINNTK